MAKSKKSTGQLHIELVLKAYKIKFENEFKFLHHRKFRFDIAIPEEKIAIEYEGLMSSKSRHTSIKGYSADCDKYNLAAINGWKVLRFTALNYKDFNYVLKELINNQFKKEF